MRLTIIKDDNLVIVDGVAHKVDCSGLPADLHALQWDGKHGEIEHRMVKCDHCGGRSKKPNLTVSDVAAYQPYVDAWNVAKIAADAAKAAKLAERAKANAAGPKD